MSVQAFPVRLAETLNRLCSARVERADGALPRGALALVTLGGRSFVAPTYGERDTRRGRQTLVSVHGRLTWIANERVELLHDVAA